MRRPLVAALLFFLIALQGCGTVVTRDGGQGVTWEALIDVRSAASPGNQSKDFSASERELRFLVSHRGAVGAFDGQSDNPYTISTVSLDYDGDSENDYVWKPCRYGSDPDRAQCLSSRLAQSGHFYEPCRDLAQGGYAVGCESGQPGKVIVSRNCRDESDPPTGGVILCQTPPRRENAYGARVQLVQVTSTTADPEKSATIRYRIVEGGAVAPTPSGGTPPPPTTSGGSGETTTGSSTGTGTGTTPPPGQGQGTGAGAPTGGQTTTTTTATTAGDPGGAAPAAGGGTPAGGGATATGGGGAAPAGQPTNAGPSAIAWDNILRPLNDSGVTYVMPESPGVQDGTNQRPLNFARFLFDGAQRIEVTQGNWDCVLDRTTGLSWEIKTAAAGLLDQNNTFTWYDPDPLRNGGDAGAQNGGTCPGAGILCDTSAYIAAINGMNNDRGLCGFNDWRLPTLTELMSIINFSIDRQGEFGRGEPGTDNAFFPNSPGGGGLNFTGGPYPYWTAHTSLWTQNGVITAARATAILISGTTNQTGLGSGQIIDPAKNRPGFIRLVRGTAPAPIFSGDITGPNTCVPLAAGQSRRVHLTAPTARFQVNAGTALDRQTGLMWSRCAMGQTLDANRVCQDAVVGTPERQDLQRTWQGALQRAQELNNQNFLGFNNWRLPTLKELVSIMEPGCNSFSGGGFIGAGLNQEVFPIWRVSGQNRGIWSSTPSSADGLSWYAFFGGTIGNGPSGTAFGLAERRFFRAANSWGWMLVRDVP